MGEDLALRMQFEMEVQAADKTDRTITCVIVSNSTNRGKRKVDIMGCQYEEYMKSPVVLAFHDDERVIGKCLWLKFQENGIVARFEFRDSELANDIFSLYKEGFLTSWSIGFLPVSWNYEEEDGVEIIHITKWILLEVSAVSIPMDSNAVTLAISQGIVHDEYLIQSVKAGNDPLPPDMELRSAVKSLEDTVHIVKEMCYLEFDNIKSMMDDMQGKLKSLDSVLQEIGGKMTENEENTVQITDFSNFSKEVLKEIKKHVNEKKGVMSYEL